MIKTIFILLTLIPVNILPAQADTPQIVVHDMDGDAIADTVRIDTNDWLLVCNLSSQEFRPVSSYTYNADPSITDYSLAPVESGFMLLRDSDSQTLYRDEYIFTYNAELKRMVLAEINLKYTEYEMQLPGIAGTVLYKNCDLNYDLRAGKLSLSYSDGPGRATKVFTTNRTAGVPFQYFSFGELPGRLYKLRYGLSWVIMDELYPVEQRTPEFIDALPVDPRTPYIVIHDIDGDRVQDTVRIHGNYDDRTTMVECLLSTHGFKPLCSVNIQYDPRHSGLKPLHNGFVLRTEHSESDVYDTWDSFTYDPVSGKMLFSYSEGKSEVRIVYMPGRIYGVWYEDAQEQFFPLEGRYTLEYSENGQRRRKEYTGEPFTIDLEYFNTTEHFYGSNFLWNGFRESVLECMDFPARRQAPEWATELYPATGLSDYYALDIDEDDRPDILKIDWESRVMTLRLSGADTTLSSDRLSRSDLGVVGNWGRTIILKYGDYYCCWDYDPQYGRVLLGCIYVVDDRGNPDEFQEETIYYPIEGFVQKKTKSLQRYRYSEELDEEGYEVLWETRSVVPLVIDFNGLDFGKLISVKSYLDKQFENVRNSPIEIPDEIIHEPDNYY